MRTDIRTACVNQPELFHPVGDDMLAVLQALTAIDVCIDCPLMVACRADADQRNAASRPRLDEVAGGWDYNRSRRIATDLYLLKQKHQQVEPKHRRVEQTKPCGTYPAYARHLRHGERPCQPCKQALRDYKRDQTARRAAAKAAKQETAPKPTGRPVTQPCGTDAAYRRHLDRNETPCVDCRRAHSTRRSNGRRQHRITGNTQRVLDTIVERGTTDPRELSKRLGLEPHKVSRCLRILRDKQLLVGA